MENVKIILAHNISPHHHIRTENLILIHPDLNARCPLLGSPNLVFITDRDHAPAIVTASLVTSVKNALTDHRLKRVMPLPADHFAVVLLLLFLPHAGLERVTLATWTGANPSLLMDP
jgi:hypothetical protein